MKKYAFLIIAASLGLVSTLRAEDVIIQACNQQCAKAAVECAPKCAPVCADTCKKTCVPSTETRIKETREYSSRCIDFCVPRCSMRGCLSGGCGKKGCDSCNACDNGSCHKCGKVHTRKVLILRIKKEEECVNTCVVVDAPCAPACGSVIVECAPAKKAETLPTAPKTEKK